MYDKKTIVISFNKLYIKYATMAIHSLLVTNPDYDINCLAINVKKLTYYPFNDSRVKLKYETKHFEPPTYTSPNKQHNYDPERCFMTTCRFDFAFSLICCYNLVIIMDVDSIVIKSFIDVENAMADKNIGVIKITDKEPDYAKYSAAFIVFNTFNTYCIEKWFVKWKNNLQKLNLYFFNDQLAIYKAINEYKLEYLFLSTKKYCSFIKYPETVIVMTAGRIKETRSIDYNKECERVMDEIEKHGNKLNNM